MNGNLFKIVLVSVVAILLAIIGGIMSADGDPLSIVLAVSPFILAALFLMKGKVWYLWILIPILFLPIPSLRDYAPLLAYGITLPCYLWNAMLRRSSLTWNSAPLLDAVVLVLFMHVGYIFLSHPFALGLDVLEDYYGGKGYILFLQALLAYLCLSSLKTTSHELGKVLQWAVFLTIVFTLILTARSLLSPDSAGADLAASAGSAGTLSENSRRSELTLTVIGLTGSNGKTSTKDLTDSVLSQGFRTIATQGNLNNHIGVPLSILRATPSDEAAVWEMGMNHSGELAPLCEMTRPKIGIITSIGTSHMEYLGSRENIAREKCTLAHCLPEDGFMIFPADCDYADMIRQSTRAACIDCGIGAGTVRAENPVSTENGTRFILSIPDFCREEVELPVHGRHMVTNALLAAAAGWVAGLAKEQIASGLTQARLTGGRLHCSRINGILVVDDTYNANPDSMQAALRTLAELSCAGRRFAVLGRMGELGVFSEEGHVLVGRTAEELRLDCVVSVGTDAARITDAISPNSFTQRLNFSSAEEAAEWLRSHTAPGDIVLFKGSRLARMEQVMNLTFPPQ